MRFNRFSPPSNDASRAISPVQPAAGSVNNAADPANSNNQLGLSGTLTSKRRRRNLGRVFQRDACRIVSGSHPLRKIVTHISVLTFRADKPCCV